MAVARDLSGGKNNVIAVIGDGAMSAGMAYEAMNNAGAMNSRLRRRDTGMPSSASASPPAPTARPVF